MRLIPFTERKHATLAKLHNSLEYQVSAIAVPKIENMKEIVQSDIKAKVEAKIPGCEKGQKEYAKQYRINIHNWSYGRLIENITTQASKFGIAIVVRQLPLC